MRKLYSDSWAVLIGVDKFQHPKLKKKQLDTVINDVDTIKKILRDNCDYSSDKIITITGHNATYAHIRETFDTELNEKIGENDRLLIFYSGHGESRGEKGKRPEKGYLAAYDTQFKKDKINWQTMLEMDEFIPYIEERISARQILFLIDCCFSGMIQKSSESIIRSTNRCTLDMRRATKKKTRQAYAAGGRGEAILSSSNVNPPISIFVEALKRTLERIDPRAFPENFLAASKLAADVTVKVKEISINLEYEQNPTYYFFNNDEGGEFVFKEFSEEEIKNAQKRPTVTYEPLEDFIRDSDLATFFAHGNINAINRVLEAKFPNGYSLMQLYSTVLEIVKNEGGIIPYLTNMPNNTRFPASNIVTYMTMNILAIGLHRRDFNPKLVDWPKKENYVQ